LWIDETSWLYQQGIDLDRRRIVRGDESDGRGPPAGWAAIWYHSDDLRRGHWPAVLGSLLGLLRCSSHSPFAMSANRYDARRQLVVAEANVLGGLNTCQSGLLPETRGRSLKSSSAPVCRMRAQLASLRHDAPRSRRCRRDAVRWIHERMWKVIQQAALAQPPAHGADAMLKGLVIHRRSSGTNVGFLKPGAGSVNLVAAV